ncbi:hypothetical protein EYF80_067281 [Liparis tanakae]|uniref:Uncharacterized protein n=1 Tax=Liparis tanakae TaxID=230148 RepID=A0A4Z2E1F4_9TELE|nr:hypothetical protein EYF80_067281 [Liparis tanakae]
MDPILSLLSSKSRGTRLSPLSSAARLTVRLSRRFTATQCLLLPALQRRWIPPRPSSPTSCRWLARWLSAAEPPPRTRSSTRVVSPQTLSRTFKRRWLDM